MNFSNNAKLKKNVSLILVMVMVLSLFAGCKKDAETETTPETTPGLNINLEDATLPEETASATTPTEATQESENMATVTSRMNVRAKPAVDAVIVYTLEAGDRIEITRQEYVVGYNWGYTPTVPNGGWVVMDFVEMDNQEANPEANQTPAQNDPSLAPTEGTEENSGNVVKTRVTINTDELKIRSEGSTDGKVLGTYKRGDTVTVTETKDGWGKTDKGWIKLSYTTSASSTDNSGSTSNSGSSSSGTSSSTTIQSNGSTTVQSRGVVTTDLNVRSKPSTDGEKITTLKYGARVEILETSGKWGRTSKGWIHMDYIYTDGTTGKHTDNGTVTGDELNIRSGPGTEYSSLGHYNSGDRVKILEKFTYGNTTWGCTSKGWISLAFVDLDSSSNDDDDDDNNSSSNSSSSDGRTGWITTAELNIRDGAGSAYDVVGSYFEDDKVTILETSGNWGRTDKGWISLSFVDFENAPQEYDDGTYSTGSGTIIATELRIREGAGTGYEVVGSYEYGDEVTILEVDGNWGRTRYGWIDLDYVDMD